MGFEFNDIKVPEELDKVVEQSMELLRLESKRIQKRKWISKSIGVAACLSIVGFGAVKPVAAAKIPLIGHIFETMQEHFSYGGDYNGIGKALTSETEISNITGTEDETADNKIYTKTVDDVTITLSEVYCNEQAIYLSMEIKSEEVIPDIYAPQLFTSEKYSFNSSVLSDCPVLNGERIDVHTYAGLIRLDLNDKKIDSATVEKRERNSDADVGATDVDYMEPLKVVEIPETFTLDLSIDEIRGGLKNPENVIAGLGATEEVDELFRAGAVYNGPWEFSIDISRSSEDTTVVELKDKAEDGIGFSAIVKDRFEMTVYGLNKIPEDMGGYFPVLLDANGRLMDYGSGGSVNTVAINDHDVSTVYLYLVDNDIWLDSLKCEWWKSSEGLTDEEEIKAFKKLLQDNCAYQTEVHFN